VLFHTRWTLSYLRGPLTQRQIQDLMARRKAEPPAPPATAEPAVRPRTAATGPPSDSPYASTPPPLPPGISQGFLAVTRPIPAGASIRYDPFLLGVGKLHWVRKSAKVDEWKTVALCVPLCDQTDFDPWGEAEPFADLSPDIQSDPDDGGRFAALPPAASRERSYTRWSKALTNHLYRDHAATVLRSKELKQYSRLNEEEAGFRVRLRHLLHEKRDLRMEKLRKRYAPKLRSLEDRIRRAEERVAREKSQMQQQGLQTAISLGSTILGALFGRKRASVGNVGRAASTLRSAGRAARERGDVSRAEENVESLKQRLLELNAEFEGEIAEIRDSADVESLELESITIRPRKSDIVVERCDLVWLPHVLSPDGRAQPAYDA
jgi:hypothetical protein